MKKLNFILFSLLLIAMLGGCSTFNAKNSDPQIDNNALTENEAKKIAESTCIKGEESLALGYYNENTKTWWFDANLNSTQEGCNPACVVFEDTKTAEINWRCTGLIEQETSTNKAIQKFLIEKYPKYAGTLYVNISQETEKHARGNVVFEAGAPGGYFFATKIDNVWQVVFDGNGQIPCSLSEYDFPTEMLSDCAE